MKFIMMHVRGNSVAHLGVLLNDGSAVDITAAIPKPEFSSLMALIEANATLSPSPQPSAIAPGIALPPASMQSSPIKGEGDKGNSVGNTSSLPSWERDRERGSLSQDLRNQIDQVTSSVQFHVERANYRLAAPLPRPTQFRDSMCFFQHIEQCAFARGVPRDTYQLPDIYRRQPVYYIGNRMNVSAPEQDIAWPRYSQLMDFELELACVIGTQAKNLSPENALEHVFGFTIFNDFSARDAQGREMEGRLGPAKGKHFDGANVFGPCVVTRDEIGDPQRLRMQARVNGETWCDNSSSTMNWSFGQLLAHISADETLYPGEVIGSGTVGNGCGLEHSRFLKDGDVVELEIEKIGVLRNRVVTQK
jgi:2-keto-4-pentenoate hydratase/2-oxohepta-3-ene-1,7-dioic acid hydratase in catechol pathway